jgi:hypothetical protein
MELNPRFRNVFVSGLVACVAAAALTAAGRPDTKSALVVHEWGTFTSVAGADGQAVPWRPLNGPSDLPCFVHVLKDGPKTWWPGGLPTVTALVRMETPVLYFYAPSEQTVDIRVDFNQGLLTEWYPTATTAPQFLPKDIAANTSTLAWTGVRVTPGAAAVYPKESAPSHYYAARETDANPLKVTNGQTEKFLFYRGLASFPIGLAATAGDDRRVRVENSGRDIPRVVLFQNRGGRIGYRIASAPRGVTTIEAPALGASVASLGADLERMLVEQGLFDAEAKAMVATWRDSWFEEGTRLFYLLPQASVDATLPLSINPAPSRVVRAFVGRLELATPEILADIERALRAGTMKALLPYARFIEPFAEQVQSRTSGIDRARVQEMLRLIVLSYGSEGGC